MAARIADRYTVGPLLGSGGMGSVHEAIDERLDRLVAIKLVPLSDTSPVDRQRFVREARAAARIHHPNAVAVFDAGDADGQLYLVMELVRGRSLAEELAAGGRFTIDGAVTAVAGVLAGLDAAHRAGVVHRDVKPGNVMRAADGSVKVVDFGIARVLDEPAGLLTAHGEFVGTPRYIAPEQVAGGDASAATDVYATGVLLHELLTGQVPYDRGSPMATAIAHRDDPVPDVRARREEIPGPIADVVRRAMAKDPAARYPSAAAMRRALLTAAAPRPVAPTTTMPVPSVVANSSRRRSPALAIFAVLLLAAGAAAIGVALARRGSGDDPGAAGTSIAAPVTTTVATPVDTPAPTAAPTPTTDVPTTVPPTTEPPPTQPPGTVPADLLPGVSDLVDVLGVDPALFGTRTNEVITRLGELGDGRGPTRRRARQLADDVARWRDTGELTPEAAAAILVVLDPLTERGDGDTGRGNGGGGDGGRNGNDDDG